MKSIAFLVATTLSIPAFALKFQGEARNEKGEIAYYEDQDLTVDAKGYATQLTTTYLDAQKKPFAVLKSDFSKNAYVPDAEFKDDRFQRTETVTLDTATKLIKIKVVDKLEKIDKENTIPFDESIVSGQGFNNYILKIFDAKPDFKETIKFVVAPKLDFFNFAITPAPSDNPALKKFKLAVSSLFLKVFVSKIEVSYDKANKRLMHFKGLSNLDDKNRKSQIVEIKYTY